MIPSSHISTFSQICPVDHSGTALQVSGWKSDDPGKTPVVCLHDLGESAAHYRGALELLAATGVSAYGFDMRGHGAGGRGSAARLRSGAITAGSIRTMQRDLLQVVAMVKQQESGTPPVLVANGFSGVLALRLALIYPKLVGGLILVDPPHPATTGVSKFRHGVTRFLAEIFPDVELPSRVLSAKKILRPQGVSMMPLNMAPVAAHELVQSVAAIPAQLAKLSTRCLIIAPDVNAESHWKSEALSFSGAGSHCEVVCSNVTAGNLPVHIMAAWLEK